MKGIFIQVPWVFGQKAIALFPFVFYVGRVNEFTRNHERIHLKQQIEMLLVLFYLWYITEYIIRFFQKAKFVSYNNNWQWICDVHYKAYRAISFEKEAFAMSSHLNYLKYRKFWAFIDYV